MKALTPRAARRLTMTGAAIASLIGCNALPQTVPSATTTGPMPAGAPMIEGQAEFTQTLTVDVDPLHGAAFERPVRQVMAVNVAGALRVVTAFPKVSHDLATGRTTVTLELTNAGDSLTYLKCVVSGDRKVISPAWGFNTTIAKAGATQTTDLVFDNPSGGGFTVNFTFTGTLNPKGVLPVTSSPSSTSPTPTPVPSSTPTSAPTSTPTTAPTPTPTPTAVPTATPTATPGTGGGTVTATASSSYGTLTADRAVDGNDATQWANSTYREAQAWLNLDLGSPKAIGSLKIRMKPQSGGAYYVIETSNDGVSYQAASGQLRSTTWSFEEKALNAGVTARHVRIHFFNDAASPEDRFYIYEAQVNGTANTDSATPTPAPTATPTPAPSSGPVATGSLNLNFEGYADGSDPAIFINPQNEGYSYDWLVNPQWRVTTVNGSKQYMHDGLSNTANLSFRRYKGTALGTANGQLPDHYFSQVDVTPIKSYTYNPTGDQGTQVYYLNPTNYVEVVIKPNYYEVWVANNAQPFSSAGWTRVKWMDLNTSANQTRRIGTEVDAVAHTLKVWLDGAPVPNWGTLDIGKLTTQAHYFALRGTGNIVAHDGLIIEPR